MEREDRDMSKKKIILIILIGIVLLALTGTGLFLFLNSQDKAPEKSDTKAEKVTSELEDFEEKEKVIYDGDVIDQSETYTANKQAAMKEEVQAALNKYYGLMYQFGPDTKDYTEDLKSLWVHGDYGSDTNLLGNVYKEFSGVNMTSEFHDYYIAVMKIRENTILPEVKVHGAVKAHFGCDKLKEGDYFVLSHLSLIKEDGEWRVVEETMDCVVKPDTCVFEKANEYDGSVNVRCDILMKWDFADVEGFLTDYTYGKNIEFSKYNKPGMYILDEEKN